MKSVIRKVATLYWLFFVILALLAPPIHAATIYVPADHSTIQASINAAYEGDEIIVSCETYVENINFSGKNIILRSTDPTSPTVVGSTVINGNGAGSVVTFSGTESSDCVLSGFTLTNGYELNGAGIYGNGTLATIQNNIITSNRTQGADLAIAIA